MTTYATISLAEPIAQGRTAEIYAWQDGWVLKLFHDWMSKGAVENEARVASAVHATGVKAPAVGEVLEMNGRYGITYERVDGVTMLRVIQSRPLSVGSLARLLAELHVEMHSRKITDIPSQRQRLIEKIQHARPLSPDLKQAALAALEKLPDGDRLCHGDFHPDNVMMSPSGAVIIDWIDATRGNPLADVARSQLLLGKSALPPDMTLGWLIQIIRRRYLRLYLERYSQLNPIDQDQLGAWFPVIAAARLSEDIRGEEARLLQIANQLLG